MKLFCASLLLLGSQEDDWTRFQKLVKDKDFIERCNAIDLIKNYKDKRMVQALLPLLADPHARVVYRTVQALSATTDPEGIALLEDAVHSHSNADVRRGVAEALGRLRRESSVSSLLKALKGSRPDAAGESAWALGEIGSPEAVGDLRAALETRAWQVRAFALEALGNGGAEEEVVGRILPRLGDADGEVQLSAARALGRRLEQGALSPGRQQEVIGALAPRLSLDRDDALLQAEFCGILERLQDAGSAGLRQRLARRLLDSEEVGRIIAGIGVAGQLGGTDGEIRVRAQLRHPHPAVREAAIRSLAEQGTGAVLEEFIGLLADPDPDVVEAAVQALARTVDAEQRQALVESLSSQPPRVWEGMLAALTALEDPGLTPRLMASCRERLLEANRYLAATELLRSQAARPAVGLLIDQLILQKQLVQNGAIRLLGALSDAGVVNDLIERLSSGDREARDKAVELLENIGDRALLEPLLPLIEAELEGSAAAAQEICGWRGMGLEGALESLLRTPDPWTQMAGVWAAATLEQGHLLERLPATPAPQVGELIAQLGARKGERDMADEDLPLTTMDKIAFLKGSSFFAALPLEELYHIALSMQEETVRQGTAVIKEGTRGDKMYIVVRGKLEVRKAGNETPIAVLAEKQVFGEMALLDDEPRSASVLATEDAHLLSLQRRDLERILRRYSSIAFNMMRILSRRLRESMAA